MSSLSTELHPAATIVERWSLARRIGFRFFFLYVLLFTWPFPLGWVPGVDSWVRWVWKPLNALTVWFGREILSLPPGRIDLGPNGSGDTTGDYVTVLVLALLALLGAAIWSLVGRRRLAHPTAHAVLRGVVRYTLALTMISYGLAKVIKTQFPDPDDGKLLQQVGEMSPMGLLWVFMGASDPYTVFGGVMELVPGALLLFRRTTTAGALLLAAVMSNVVMLNLCYDVPVKLYSMHYLAFGLWLLLPQLRALYTFFVQSEPAKLRAEGDILRGRWRWALPLAGVALVGTFTVTEVIERLGRYYEKGDGAPPLAVIGAHVVESHLVNGHEAAPEQRWKEIRLRRGRGILVPVLGDQQLFGLELDEAGHWLTLVRYDQKGGPYRFAVDELEPGVRRLYGVIDGVIHVVTMRKRDASGMLLRTRGFRWINERPFNR